MEGDAKTVRRGHEVPHAIERRERPDLTGPQVPRDEPLIEGRVQQRPAVRGPDRRLEGPGLLLQGMDLATDRQRVEVRVPAVRDEPVALRRPREVERLPLGEGAAGDLTVVPLHDAEDERGVPPEERHPG